MKGKTGSGSTPIDCDTSGHTNTSTASEEPAGGKEGLARAGDVSLVGHCMNGLTLCFKVE